MEGNKRQEGKERTNERKYNKSQENWRTEKKDGSASYSWGKTHFQNKNRTDESSSNRHKNPPHETKRTDESSSFRQKNSPQDTKWTKESTSSRNKNLQNDNNRDKEDQPKFDNLKKEEESKPQKDKINDEDLKNEGILTMKDGDLFDAPADYSLAHCVGADFKMGRGIAVEFRKKFKGLDKLYNQRVKVGGVGILEDNNRYIYYLVTKTSSHGKPFLDDLIKCLKEMKKHCLKKKVSNMAIPLIGCGLDRLIWRDVSHAIKTIFANTQIKFTVYTLQVQEEEEEEEEKRNEVTTPRVSKAFRIQTRDDRHLKNIESGAVMLLFGSKNKKMDYILDSINRKYFFLDKYNNSKENVIFLEKGNQYIYIIICKDDVDDLINYELLNQGFINIINILRKDKSISKTDPVYFGLQYFEEKYDDIVIEKVVNLLKSCCGRLNNYVECHICKGSDEN